MKRASAFLGILLCLLLGAGVTAAQDNVEITFVHIFGGENDDRGETIVAIADAFMAANPGVTVTVTSTSTDYTELFNAALLSAEQGNAPHIVQVEEGLTQLAADSTYFTPIGDLASEEQIASLDDVLPVVRQYYTIDETLWSIPWNASNPLLYYNKGMFEAAGLDPETPPTTFAEVTAACEALMAVAEEINLRACINWPMATWFPEQWVAMQNGLVALPDNGRAGARATEMNYTGTEMQTVLDWWKSLADSGYYTYSGRANSYDGEGITFLSKQTAMSINSTAGISLFQSFGAAQGIDLGIAGLPIPSEDATNGGTIGGASLWVTAGHPDAETQAAVDFIFFLTNVENDMTWHQATGYFPIHQASIDALTEAGWFDENPAYGIALDQLSAASGNVANQGAVIGPSADVRGILIEAFQSVVDSGEDVVTSLEAAKTRADAVLTEYNSLVGE